MLLNFEEFDLKSLSDPFFLFRQKKLLSSVNYFLDEFNGKTLFAVKSNPLRFILESMYFQGLKSFDVASINEIKVVRNLFSEAEIFYMNPIKSRQSINDSYFNYGVRHFALDDVSELKKILVETNYANDLNLHVRLSIPNNFAEISLSKKFGIKTEDAPSFLRLVRNKCSKLGVSFHPGSQCMNPDAFKIAIRLAAKAITTSNVEINYFNVGGGFPSSYPGLNPPELKEYFSTIHEEFQKLKFSKDVQLLAEPGRVLVSDSMSLIVRVEMRKENKLYINDGIYGSLQNAGNPNFRYPVRMIRDAKKNKLCPFSFFGPTCDSGDFMKGPFYLPDSIQEGDFIEIGQMGAYSFTMKTDFNGFFSEPKVLLVNEDLTFSTLQEINKKKIFNDI